MDNYYNIFESEVVAPFVEVRTLSNGEKVGKYYGAKIEDALTHEEVIDYINENHIEALEDGV